MKLIKFIIFLFLTVNFLSAMERPTHQDVYDFSSKEIEGFFPSHGEIISKNIEIIQSIIHQQLKVKNYITEHVILDTKDSECRFFTQLAIDNLSVDPQDRHIFLQRLLKEPKLSINNLSTKSPIVQNNYEYFFSQKLLPQGSLVNQKNWIRNNFKLLFETNLSFQKILTLIRHFGVSTNDDIDLILDIKRAAIENNIIKNFQEFRELYSEVIMNSFYFHDEYFEKNSLALLGGAFQLYLSHEARTRRDFNEIRALLINIRIHPHYEINRQSIVTSLQLEANDLSRKILAYTLKKLKNRVISLFREVNPRINYNTTIKFFLIQEEILQDHLKRGKISQGICNACFDSFTADDCGLQCLYHLNSNPHSAIHYQELEGAIKASIRNNSFPTTCETKNATHELPIDDRILQMLEKDNLLTHDDIEKWKFGTLLAYHQFLFRIKSNLDQSKDIKYCSTGDCGTLIFAKDKDPITNAIRCPKCDFQRCYNCDNPPHDGRTCVENRRFINEMKTGRIPLDSPIRPCPYCLRPIDKSDGCNSIKCQCDNEFNVEFGKPREFTTYSQLHFEGSLRNPRKYLVRGEPGYTDDKSSAFPKDQGAIKRDKRE